MNRAQEEVGDILLLETNDIMFPQSSLQLGGRGKKKGAPPRHSNSTLDMLQGPHPTRSPYQTILPNIKVIHKDSPSRLGRAHTKLDLRSNHSRIDATALTATDDAAHRSASSSKLIPLKARGHLVQKGESEHYAQARQNVDQLKKEMKNLQS